MTDLFSTLDGTNKAAEAEAAGLAAELATYDDAYHNKDAPLVDDATYDAKKRRLASLVRQDPQLGKHGAQLAKVGATPDGDLPQIAHATPMLSLDNAFELADLERFALANAKGLGRDPTEPLDLLAELKIDGLSISLAYERGELVAGATRGDGRLGENVTANIRRIAGIPHRLAGDAPDLVEVRGEIYMPKASFEALNERHARDGGRIFANPRAAAAGSLRNKDPEVTATRDLHMFAYAVGAWNGSPRPETQQELLKQLSSWGFAVNDLTTWIGTLADAMALNAWTADMRSRLPYDIDGIVYKQNRRDAQERLGMTSTTPRWAIAWKFDAERAKTQVESITIQVGRTGKLTPVAELKPVTVGGVVIRRATLHNEDEIARKDVRAGDTIVVQRAGDVIPQVVEVDLAARPDGTTPFIFPTRCPACGAPAVREEGEVDRRCTGDLGCDAQRTTRLVHMVSRTAFDIDGLGEKAVAELRDAGLIDSPADVFRLRGHRNKIAGMPGWGGKSTENLLASIEAKRTIPLDRFILSLGIRRIGNHASPILARCFGSFDAWFDAMRRMDEATAMTLETAIGPASKHRLRDFFAVEANVAAVRDLAEQLDIQPAQAKPVTEHAGLAGKTIVFTGTFSTMKRDEARALAESLGAKTSDSISKKTTLLVVGADAGGKAKKAADLGVETTDEAGWLALVAGATQAA